MWRKVTQRFLIAAGGWFVIAGALALGMLIAPRTNLPLPVRFVSGAVLTATGVFLILTVHAGFLFVWLLSGLAVIKLGASGQTASSRCGWERDSAVRSFKWPWFGRLLNTSELCQEAFWIAINRYRDDFNSGLTHTVYALRRSVGIRA
jgi:hypothetical protein